jgi:diguanylate cyclase (GGDEF)-like protein
MIALEHWGKEQNDITRPSLRRRYLSIAAIVALLLLGGSLFASLHVKQVTRSNAQTLELNEATHHAINGIRDSIWQVDTALNAMLINPDTGYLTVIRENMERTEKKLDDLVSLKSATSREMVKRIDQLHSDYMAFKNQVLNLIELRDDADWVYPMLPYIRQILLESNTEFISAINAALNEIEEEGKVENNEQLYRKVDAIKDLWNEAILNFRAVIIRFAGLNTSEKLPQENNIRIVHDEIQSRLKELDRLKEQGLLGLETDQALTTLHYRSEKWYQDYQELLKIKSSNRWRADLQYLEVEIQPRRERVISDLGLLEEHVEEWSKSNVNAVENVANQINLGLWGLSGLALAFVVMVYLLIDRSVLVPVRKIATALSSEVRDIESLKIPEKGSHEISMLISAFNGMRSQIHQRQRALEYQALHDALTGLPNRALLQDRLEQAIHVAHRQETGMALMLLDLDHFKEINDTLGHPVGDMVLQKMGQRLSEYLRESDTVARLGGDEFAIIAMDVDEEYAHAFAEKIVQAIKQVVQVGNQNLYVGASVGVALYPEHGSDVATLVRHVDIAMYHAKRNNNDYAFYQPSMNGHSAENLSLIGDLRTELLNEHSNLQLYYQPKVDLFTREVLGVEALLRWNHPDHARVSPEQVVLIAEHAGLIGELTQWVLERAIADCAAWHGDGIDIGVAVNLSAWNLQDPDLPAAIGRCLEKHHLDPEYLTLEITESAVMSEPVRARQILNELDRMGMDLLIDDYGTGFSSLAYLKLLPVRGLKIDKSFVLEMQEDENDAIIVKSTIDLAHNLGLEVTAEGVENREQSLWLRQHKCNSAQGHYFSRPVPEAAFRDWLKSYQARAAQ